MNRIMKKSTKRLLSAILAFTILLSLPMGVINASAANEKYNENSKEPEFQFDLNKDRTLATLVRYNGKEKNNLVIPGSFEGCPVYVDEDVFMYNPRYFGVVTLSEGVTGIGVGVFSTCNYLTRIEVSSTIRGMPMNAFLVNPELREINVSENNLYLTSVDGVVFSKDMTRLYIYPQGKNVTGYIVPDGVEKLSYRCFWGSAGLETIIIPDSVVSIESEVFSAGQKAIVMPKSVTYFDEMVFANCKNVTIYYEGTQEDWAQIENVEKAMKKGNKTVLFEQTENLPTVENDPIKEAELDRLDDEALEKAKNKKAADDVLKDIFALPALAIAYTRIFLMFIGMGIGTGLQKVVAFLLPWVEWTS